MNRYQTDSSVSSSRSRSKKNKNANKSAPPSHVSNFKSSLRSVPIASNLTTDGIPVMRVKASGNVQHSILRLSPDKFTLLLTSTGKTTKKNGGGGEAEGTDSASTSSSSRLSSLKLLRSRSSPQAPPNHYHSNDAMQSTTNNIPNHITTRTTPTPSSASSISPSPVPVIPTPKLSTTESPRGLTSSPSISSINTASSTSTTSNEHHTIDVGTIDRIQRGQVTYKFEMALKSQGFVTANHHFSSTSSLAAVTSSCAVFEPTKSLSIVFRGGSRTLDLLVCGSETQRDELVDALETWLQAYQTAKAKVSNEVLLLRYIWMDTATKDPKRSDTLNVNELSKVLDRINYSMKKKELQNTYDKFAKIVGLDRSQRKRGFTFEQTSTFLHKLKRDSWRVKPVQIIWNNLFGEYMNNGKLRTNVSCTSFLEKFLKGKQGETHTTMEQVKRLFQKLNRMEMPIDNNDPDDDHRIDRDRFEAYLFSRDNDAFSPNRERFDKRLMTKPISEYWINSSHNTYLTGDQLTSHSSVEMYMHALYRGCRCLELDVWDSDRVDTVTSQPVPVVWHGHTMTSKILFVDIIRCLKTFMDFHPQTYPLILSFENHCSLPYQEVMAQELEAILGDTLYVPTEASLVGRLPSPEDLRGKIVIKGRRPDGAVVDDDDDDYSDDGSDEESDRKTASLYSESTTTTTTASSVKHKKRTKRKIVPALARLTLLHGCNLKNWDESVRNPTHHMHSFSENRVKKLFRQGTSRKWAIYNQSHMSRTYPAGSRVDSSNYNPVLAWSSGCQMVALNFQTPDAPLKVNDGRFRENGQCGYVLKPTSLVMKDELSLDHAPVSLSVRVLSGSCLPKPRAQRSGDCISPYVKVSVFDVKKEEKESTTSYTTHAVQDNGYFPIWHNAMDRDKFHFLIDNADVAILHFEVNSKGDEFVAFSSIPIACLRQGYRSVQLMDSNNTRNGPFSFASLLVEIKMKRVPVVAEI